jgi:hypothetical protein
VAEPHATSGVGFWAAIGMFLGFGMLLNLHQVLQTTVLINEGAMAVGMVNAFRAALVSVASGLVFCSIDTPYQCLTWQTASSAAVVTAGALMWAISKPDGAKAGMSRKASHGKIA